VTKLLGVKLDCKLSWSKHIDTTVAKTSIHNKALLYLNNTIIKVGPSFVTPRLLFSSVVKCHKKGIREIAVGSEQGSTAGP
jgi:hypothetical protein